ncbi:MAG: histidine kinase [Owenweeksia sp.]|nr:histidine kinase [Owenweeksia sp.]
MLGFLIPLTFNPEGYISIEGWKTLWDDILYCFFVSLGISGSVGFTENRLRHIPWVKFPLKRFIIQFVMITALCFPVVFTINFLFYWVFGLFTLQQIPWHGLARQTYIPILVGYAITAFFLSRAFLMEWRQAAVDAEKLRAEHYKGQVRFLKDQLNPHFLFNSLNILTNTVYEDSDKAAHYIRQLSRFYRYVLEVQDKEVVQLEQELEFTKRYFESTAKPFWRSTSSGAFAIQHQRCCNTSAGFAAFGGKRHQAQQHR